MTVSEGRAVAAGEKIGPGLSPSTDTGVPIEAGTEVTLGDGERVGMEVVTATCVALIPDETIQFMVATGSGATSPATR